MTDRYQVIRLISKDKLGGVYLSAAELAKIQSRETTSTARPPLPPGQKMLALGDSVDLLEVALHVIRFLFS